ncbi:MAG: agmatinase, partial [SAR202 cluster bacterium]|nr:agmatinase [SAR202 cluster bacterium]
MRQPPGDASPDRRSLVAVPVRGFPYTPSNFLAMPPEQSLLETSRVVVLPVPYDAATSFRGGAREGPRAIIEASWHMEDYDAELRCEPCGVGIHTLPELEPVMSGPEAMAVRVEATVAPLARGGKLVALLGGDHSLTPGAVKACRATYPDLSVLYLDAHADLREEYQGSRHSHACSALRSLEQCPLTLVGVRSLALEEARLIAERRVPYFPWPASRSASLANDVVTGLSSHVYVSVDLDVLDPSIMPAVGTPEPGGLTWEQLLALLR